MMYIRRIIYRMLEFAKRCWQVFFPIFAIFLLGGFQALYYLDEYKYQWVVIAILFILAVICLIIGIIASVYVIKAGLQKDREVKAAEVEKQIEEGIRELNQRMG